MKYKKCPICELNYITEDLNMCDVCKQKSKPAAPEKPDIKHKGNNIFWVFQGKEYEDELIKGYIWAPLQDKAGHSPAHWIMLENVKEGDIIFHGVARGIWAISVATSTWFTSKIKDGITPGRQVNCRAFFIKKTIIPSSFRDQIISTCNKYKYQPFDKNGDGRQGYLFDLNDELAGIFARELNKKNPNIATQINGFSDLLKL